MIRRGKTTTGNAKIGVGYLRVSTDRQDLGPEAQRASIAAWATANGVRIVAWFLDKGISGASELEDRPELIAAIAALKAHEAGVFLVAKRDRLARDTLIAQLIEKAVNKVGGSVVSADGLGNGDDPASKMLRSILDAVAEYERAVIRARVKAALKVKAERAERVGAVPFGYRLHEDRVHIVPVADEQGVIGLARDLRAEGFTYRDIAEALEGLGHLSRTGKLFHPQQVCRMLQAA
jgi:DNA invertase Pin-like site-specific DNA recombinase